MDKRKKLQYIKNGIKHSFMYSIIGSGVLTIIALIYSLVKHAYILKSIYMAFYYGGGFILIFAVPLLLKRNEDPNLRKIRRASPLYGFYDMFNPYLDEAMAESCEEFKADGFWLGIFIVFVSLLLFLYAFILESIFFSIYIGG